MSRDRLGLELLDTLLALVDSDTFGEAGERLGVAQSTVSQHLKRLEETLGTALILRDQRGCRPTPAALRLLPFARSLLTLEQRVVDAALERKPRLGACSNIGVYLLPDLLRDFGAAGGTPPDIVIGSNPEIVMRLERSEVDAALLEWWDERAGFHWQSWRTEAMVVIVPPTHELRGAGAVSRADLARLPLIGGEPGTGTGRLLRAACGGSVPDVTMTLGSTEAVKRAVAAGLGVSLVMASTVANEVRDGHLCALPIEEPFEKPLFLVWRGDLDRDDPLVSYLGRQSEGPGQRDAGN